MYIEMNSRRFSGLISYINQWSDTGKVRVQVSVRVRRVCVFVRPWVPSIPLADRANGFTEAAEGQQRCRRRKNTSTRGRRCEHIWWCVCVRTFLLRGRGLASAGPPTVRERVGGTARGRWRVRARKESGRLAGRAAAAGSATATSAAAPSAAAAQMPAAAAEVIQPNSTMSPSIHCRYVTAGLFYPCLHFISRHPLSLLPHDNEADIKAPTSLSPRISSSGGEEGRMAHTGRLPFENVCPLF